LLEVMMLDDGAPRGSLWFDADRVRRFTALKPRVISIHHRLRPERTRAEAYLEARYAEAFQGHITHHYPTLMSIQDRDGVIHAVVGFRFAARAPLFLEHYLDRPIETSLSDSQGGAVPRHAIAEIGNLASQSPGASLFLFLALAKHLHHQGCTHAAATATRRLRRGFARVGFATRRLAQASASRIANGGADWGTYYENDPEVLAGPIAPALPALAHMLLTEPLGTPNVWPRLHPTLGSEIAR
jgi:hypothetical protein